MTDLEIKCWMAQTGRFSPFSWAQRLYIDFMGCTWP